MFSKCKLHSILKCFRVVDASKEFSLSDYDTSSTNSDVELSSTIKARARKKRLKVSMRKSRFWGLCCYSKKSSKMAKMERTVKATLLIQKWFRRYMARLELRRRYTWNIFQSLEYAGEQDQVKLYNFFNALMSHIPTNTEDSTTAIANASSIDEYFTILIQDDSDDDEVPLSGGEKEFRISFPLTEDIVRSLIEIYKTKRHFRLPARDVGEILKRSIICLRKLPNLNPACTALAKQITVCGDLHGKFDDLLCIFHKNGFPSHENPYVFNGDFVDRGRRGIEVFIALLCLFLLYPEAIFLNRGNHEDSVMNSRYGFIREVQQKYPRTSAHILKLIEGVYRWLPLGTLINNKVLVVHGGISDVIDLDAVKEIERGKYVSLLRPPLSNGAKGSDCVDKAEWKQVFDLLWSDPMTGNGCVPNTLRGAGTYFGPNVTSTFLKKHNLSFLIRSHECKLNGYELCHDDKVVTIFSASNYYEVGSNKGAYLNLLGDDLQQHFVQFSSTVGKGRNLNCFQKMSIIESSVVREIQGQITKNQSKLEAEFQALDSENTGFIAIGDWCKAMELSTGLELPWRMLRDKLVTTDPDNQMVAYRSTFDNIGKTSSNSVQGVQGYATVAETLYKNRQNLEAIFRIIDKDNSGYINREEFHEACELIKEYLPASNSMEQMEELCGLMDLNKDGLIDLNEFLESFRMVHKDTTKHEQERDEITEEKDSVPEVTITDISISTTEAPSKKNLKNEVAKRDSPESGSPTSLPLFSVSPLSSASADVFPTKDSATDKRSDLGKTKSNPTPMKSNQISFSPCNSVQSLNFIELSEKENTEPLLKSNSTNILAEFKSDSQEVSPKVMVKSPVLSTRRGSQI
ncbi:hypothetical protein WA026_014011 [Henosepilachna vigintioctopunctata]|uniref:Serine/threonine-protein phosphatase n=1 Tax=Henosepilachna vigintioctopunctata TaxID=420089 RepID=A0AAW1U8P0_9CUCU